MILELFVVLIAVFLVMVYIGYKAETPLFAMLGYFFIFLLSFTLINNQLEYKSGYTESWLKDVRCCSNYTNYAYDTNTVTFNYTTFANSKTYGIYLAIGSALMFILTLIQATKLSDRVSERFE